MRALGFFGRCRRPIARSLNLLMKGDRGRLLRAFSRAREAEPGALGGAGAGRRGEFLAGLPAISFCWNGRGVGRYGVRFARRGAATSPAGATEVRALGFFGRCRRPIARSLNLLMKGDRGRLLRAFSRAREAEPGALGGAGAGRRGEFLAGLPAISFCWNGRGVGRYGVRFARRGAATSPAGGPRPPSSCVFPRAEAEPGALGGERAGRRGEFLAGLPAISFCWNGRGVGRYGVRFARRGAATSPAGGEKGGAPGVRARGFFGRCRRPIAAH